jgi:hypothetical protein
MKRSGLFSVIALIGLLLFIFHPFLKNQLINTDDGEFQAARSANYYLALKQGQLPVRWAPNLSNGYGYPLFLFSYHLPYIAVTGLYALADVPFQFALNLVTVGSIIVGAIGIWFIAKHHSLTSPMRVLAALLYTLAPYTLITVFLRGAAGEILFMGLLPWIIYLEELLLTTNSKKHRLFYGLAYIAVLTAFLLTHPPSLFVAVPLAMTFGLFLLKNHNLPLARLISIIIPSCISVLLTLWFWVPALLEKKYVIMSNESVLANFLIEFPTFQQLVVPQLLESDLFGVRKIVTIGYPLLIVVVSAVLLVMKKKHKSPAILFWLGWFLIGFLIALPISMPAWKVFPLLQYMQFPWRILWLTTFAGTMVFIELWTQHKLSLTWKKYIVGGLSVFLVFSVLNYTRYRGIQQWPDYELLEYFKQGSSYNEHQPIWASAYTRQYPTEKFSLRVPGQTYFIDEKAQPASLASIKDLNWTGSVMHYTVTTEKPVEVIQKTYYFPGWKVLIDGQDVAFTYEDREFPGHIVITVPSGEHSITVKFANDTPARKIGDRAFGVGVGLLIVYVLSTVLIKKRKGRST